MDLSAFRATLDGAEPPACRLALQALWHAAKGDWERAHELTNDTAGQAGAWVHAYLHRVEGDLSNADYWYARANRPRPSGATEQEWDTLVAELLGRRA